MDIVGVNEVNKKINKEEAINNIISIYGNKILKICYVQLSNLEDAEDAAQEVLIKVVKSLNKYKGESSIYTWIYKITINTCYDILKKRKNAVIEDISNYQNLTVENDDTEEIVLKNLTSKNIREALMLMNEKYRIILYMFYFEEFKISQIANILDSNENTIKTNMRRGKVELKNIIESRCF